MIRLVVVAMDTGHSVYVYDWRKKRQVGGGRGHMGDPPQVYGVEWNPYEISHNVPSSFLQFGKKHLRMWTKTEAAVETWTSKALSFGKLQMRHIMSAQWLLPRAGGTECLVAAGEEPSFLPLSPQTDSILTFNPFLSFSLPLL